MKGEPFLTIAIPTYNGAKTIGNALNVLLSQVTDEVEIIISDNCSTDETPIVINEFLLKYPFIRVLHNEKNVGADGNFLRCIRSAKGKYMMLLSDDDILIENSVDRIIRFLKKNRNISLAFLETVMFYDVYKGLDKCEKVKPYIEKDVVTHNKREFFYYTGSFWGFTSSYIWKTERCQTIQNPEQYLNTYWLQSYISILCSNKEDDKLGVISGPCVAAGGYGVINNYDIAIIEGVFNKKMLDFAVDNGYDKDQLEKSWVHNLSRRSAIQIIKEKSAGKQLASKRKLFSLLKKYPYAWIHLFPVLIFPSFICKLGIRVRHKIQGRGEVQVYINRPT